MTYDEDRSQTSGGMHSGRGAGVGGQVLGAGESVHFSDFKQDDGPQDEAYAGQAHDQGQFGCRCKDLADPAFKKLDLLLHCVQLRQQLFGGKTRVRGQLCQDLLQQFSPLLAEQVADLPHAQGVLGQRGMNAVFQPGARSAEGHSRARQLPLVAQFS